MLSVFTVGLGAGWLLWRSKGSIPQDLAIQSLQTPTIQDVRSLAVLLSSRTQIADVCIIDGYLGGAEVAVLLRGQEDFGVDLHAAQLHEVNAVHRTAVLRLPLPTVISATIDNEKTRIVALTYSGLWLINPQPSPTRLLVDRSLAETQRLLTRLGSKPGRAASAQRQMETVLSTSVTPVEWKFSIHWGLAGSDIGRNALGGHLLTVVSSVPSFVSLATV